MARPGIYLSLRGPVAPNGPVARWRQRGRCVGRRHGGSRDRPPPAATPARRPARRGGAPQRLRRDQPFRDFPAAASHDVHPSLHLPVVALPGLPGRARSAGTCSARRGSPSGNCRTPQDRGTLHAVRVRGGILISGGPLCISPVSPASACSRRRPRWSSWTICPGTWAGRRSGSSATTAPWWRPAATRSASWSGWSARRWRRAPTTW